MQEVGPKNFWRISLASGHLHTPTPAPNFHMQGVADDTQGESKAPV